MLRRAVLISTILIPHTYMTAQAQASKDRVPVEVVATASEYIPRSTTVSHPGHSYTDCSGRTSYFGRFSSYGDSGYISGTAETNTHCSTTFSPPTETTLTTYRRVNYTIAKGENTLYLLSCTQLWKPTAKERVLLGIMGGLDGASGNNSGATDRTAANAKGKWSACPAFVVGTQYTLKVNNTSDARLEGAAGGKPIKLEYLGSAALPEPSIQSARLQAQAASTAERAIVHITSSLSGGEIYVDGKFYGNTPSDISLVIGEHIVKVTIGGKECSRSIQITPGEIRVHADMVEK